MWLLSFLAVTSALVFSANGQEAIGACKEIASIINRNETTNKLIQFNGNITIFAMLNSSMDACIEKAEMISDLQNQLLNSQYYQMNFVILDTTSGNHIGDRRASQELIDAAGNVTVLSNVAYNITGWLKSQQDYVLVINRCGHQVFQMINPCSVSCSDLKTAIYTTFYDNIYHFCGDCQVPYAVPIHESVQNLSPDFHKNIDNCNVTLLEPTTESVTIFAENALYLNNSTSAEANSTVSEDKGKITSEENKNSSEEKGKKSSEEKGKTSSEEKGKNSSEEKGKNSSEEKNKNASEEKSKNSSEEKNKSASEELIINTIDNMNKIHRPQSSLEVSKENDKPLPINIHLDLPNIHTINYKITKHSQIPVGKNVERNVVITEELSNDGKKHIRTHKIYNSDEAIETRYIEKTHGHKQAKTMSKSASEPKIVNDQHESIEETLNDNIIEFSNSSDVLHGFQLTDRHAMFHIYKKMLPKLHELLEQRQPKH